MAYLRDAVRVSARTIIYMSSTYLPRRITTHNGRWHLREKIRDFSSLRHIVIARESTTTKRLTTLLFANSRCWHFLIHRGGTRGGNPYGARAPRNRGDARRTFHSQRRASPPLLQKVTFTCGDELVVVPLSGDIIVSGVTAIGTCERAAGEENVGHLPREGAIDSKRAHVQTAHYLPARRTRTKIMDKRILACA